MIFAKKQGGNPPQKSRLERRISSIETRDLVTWSENALFVIGKEVTHWLRDRDDARLDEAEQGAEALLAIIRELRTREF